MSKISTLFKTREEICLWLEKHKADLEDQIGFRLNIISACDLGILAEVKDSRNLKIVCIPDFELTQESLETMEGFVDGEIGSEKHIGAIVLAESIDSKLDGYIVTLKCKTKLFRIYLIDVDEVTNKPIFKEYAGVEMQRV
jgi:hypothetical protein